MRVLAIETATTGAGVAVADEEGVVGATELRAGRRHAELLHPAVVALLSQCGLSLGEMDAIAVDVGPGLFTSIRVGVAAAKGFGLGLGVPLVPLTSLGVIREAAGAGGVVPVVDMRRGEVAWCFDGEAIEHGVPSVLVAALTARDGPGTVLAGDGALRYAGMFLEQVPGVVLAGRQVGVPPVATLALQGLRAATAGATSSPAEVQPLYLRDADVRIGWTTRHDAVAG